MTTAVVTGTGVVLPGIDDAAGLLTARVPGGERVEPTRLPTGRGMRRKDRATLLALAAAGAALTDAGLLGDDGLRVPGPTVGTVVSSNLGNVETVCRVAEALERDGPAGVSPLDVPNASSNVIAAAVALHFGLRGVNFMLCNGATSGLDAVGWAALAIGAGRVRRVVVVGAESTNPVVERLLRTAPGAGLLDGAAALVLESPAAAAERGRPARATIAGHARRRDLATATGRAARGAATGLWLPPEAGGSPPGGTGAADVRELGRTLPPASGALGVLQCAAATAWLTGGGHPAGTPATALAAAGGGPADDAAAAVLLTAP